MVHSFPESGTRVYAFMLGDSLCTVFKIPPDVAPPGASWPAHDHGMCVTVAHNGVELRLYKPSKARMLTCGCWMPSVENNVGGCPDGEWYFERNRPC
jgi:hypothetical protein